MQYSALMRIAAALSLLLLTPPQARAQPAPQYSQTQTFSSFTKVARSTDISATTSSSRQTLTPAPVAIVYNAGAVAAYVELGGNTVTANATTSTFVPPGSCVFLNAVGATSIAGITATGSATLQVETGTGTFGSCGGGGGSGGGGGGAVYGSTVVGSPAANPPVLVGGTVDGTAAGNVSILKVLGGLGFVNCANCSGSGVSAADGAAFIAGTSLLAPGGGFFQTTATSNPLTNGQTGMWQMTAQRAGFVNLRNASGAELGVSAAPLQVSLANTAANGTALLVTGTGGTFPVTGTFFQATQPVSAAASSFAVGALLDGADVTKGAKADAVCATATGNCSEIALIKYLNSQSSASIPAGTNSIGKVQPSFGTAQLSSVVVSAASSGNNTLVTRAVGTIKVYGVFFSCASSVVATLQNGTSTGVTGAMTLTTFFLPVQAEPYFTTTSTNNFVLNLGSAVQCSGTVYYLDT